MAKRRAKARTRKPGRKSQAKASSRKAARPKARVTRKAARLRASGASASARRATADRSARQAASRKAAPKARKAATKKSTAASRPKPVALARERRQLRDDDTGAPSSLNYEKKASSAESGHQMYNQRAKEHTEGGPALTAGDVDSDWNDAYASGEETPGGDMSTPDQDVVEEIGRALGVEYEDAEELKGAEKIESRDRHRWEYDPASAEDYKDRNRKE